MARYSESPSPPQRPCERGRRGAYYHDEPPDEDEYDRRVVERSARGHRGSMRGRGEFLAQPRSPSRSRSPYQTQRAPPPEEREHRRRRHAADVDGRPRHRRPAPSERPPPEAQHEPEFDIGRQQAQEVEMQPRARTRRSERDGEGDGPERSRGRRRDKGHDDQNKMSEMQRMMMSGMMHPAAMQMAMMQQMGHMGMMHPSYMAAMQQQQKKAAKRDKKKRDKPPGGPGGPSSEDSSSDSSSDSSGPPGMQPSAMAAMAAMQQQWAAMGAQPPHGQPPHAMPPHNAPHQQQHHRSGRTPRGGMPPPPPPPPPGSYATQGGASDEDIEAYLAGNPVEEDAADRLRALPPHLAAAVIARGPVSDSRDPTAVLLARLRAVEINRPPGEVPQALSVATGPRNETKSTAATENTATARSSIKQTIETMISDYRLSVGCAWTMRALPPDKQKLAAKIDPAGQADPSAYVAEELRKIV